MTRKYQFTGVVDRMQERVVRGIVATRDFGNVKAGDLGGWIEDERNLSHHGNCWVSDGCIVMKDAVVCDDAQAKDNAFISDNAIVSENALVCGNAFIMSYTQVRGNAQVRENSIVGNNHGGWGFDTIHSMDSYVDVYENAIITGCSQVFDSARAFGNAKISGTSKVFGNAMVFGHAVVAGSAIVRDRVIIFDHAIITRDADLKGDLWICGMGTIKGNVKRPLSPKIICPTGSFPLII